MSSLKEQQPESMSTPSQPRDDRFARPQPRDPRADEFVEQIQPRRQPEGDYPPIGSVPVSVLVPVRNENRNIHECLRHLSWADQLTVIDSQSTDQTVALAQAMGAEVYQFEYNREVGWPKKKNWALHNVPWRNEWVLIMDADEHVTPDLAREIEAVVTNRYAHVNGCGDAYWINRRFIFMGRWLKHCGYYPSWNVRLFKHALGQYERIGDLGDTKSGDNEIHEHVVVKSGEPGYLKHDFLHYAYPDLGTLIEKHNRYANWEARAMNLRYRGGVHPSLFGGPIARRRWLRAVSRHLPFRPHLRFIYTYLLQLGFLDGKPGYIMCKMLSWYEFISAAKHYELSHSSAPPTVANMTDTATTAEPPKSTASMTAVTNIAESTGSPDPFDGDQDASLDRASLNARTVSPWSFADKAARAIWYVVQGTLFRYSPRPMYRFRAFLLRCFGARVHKTARIRSTVEIEIPWHLSVGAYTVIGDKAILYCLGKVRVGDRVLISQYAHLCAGTHDYKRVDMPLLKRSIVIEDDAWIAADAFVAPGITVGRGCVLGARASAFSDLPDWKICVGSPAKPVADREFRAEPRES